VVLPPDVLGPPGLTESMAAAAEQDARLAQENLAQSSARSCQPCIGASNWGFRSRSRTRAQRKRDPMPRRQPTSFSWLNQAADCYASRQELDDTLAVLDKVNLVKAAQGECPLLARALETQTRIIHRLADQCRAPSEPQLKARLRVQLGKTGAGPHADAAAIQDQNRQWLALYDRKLDELVRMAGSMDAQG